MPNDTNIFRAYDIRGVYGKDITDETAERVGKAFGTLLGEGKRVVVSRDTRNSGKNLKKNLISGLVSTGCDVVDIDLATTPMMYFALERHRFDAGISVTASHNPPEWGGFKIAREHGVLYSQGMGMEEIREIFVNKNFHESDKPGKVSGMDIKEEYKKFLLSKIEKNKRLKIVLDPGNGVAAVIVGDLFKSAGHDVVVINGEIDGNFPSRAPDPKEENVSKLKDEVVENKADIGIAFDGDADRVAFVDDKGRYLASGNVTIPIFSGHYIGKEPGGKIVYDVCCSSFLDEFIESRRGVPILNKVGHSFIMNRMIEERAAFGGEYSNHLYFSEIFGFDDAMFAGLKMAEIVGSSGKTLAEIVDEIPTYPASKVVELPCDDEEKFETVSRIGEKLKKEGYKIIDIDGVKAFDDEKNWMLIRASNTVPAIKVNSEAKTEEKMEELFNKAKEITESEIGGKQA